MEFENLAACEVIKPYQLTEKQSTYSEEQKLKTVAVFASCGTQEKTSQLTGIPSTTVYYWTKTEWWQAALEKIRVENRQRLNSELTAILFSSLEQARERLDNGDVTVLKDGEIVRHPIKARDLTLMAAIMFDKRQILNNSPTSITHSESRLVGLADRLSKMVEERNVTPIAPALNVQDADEVK